MKDPILRITEAGVIVCAAALTMVLLAVLLTSRSEPASEKNEATTVCATPTPTPAPGPTATPGPTLTPAPTQTPTPTPTATPTPPSEREALAALVHGAFPDDPYMGDVVVWRETLNLNNPEGLWREYVYGGKMSATNDCGLMQTNWYWHAGKYAAHGWGLADCFDPEKNLTVAREIYDGSGPGAWTTYY